MSPALCRVVRAGLAVCLVLVNFMAGDMLTSSDWLLAVMVCDIILVIFIGIIDTEGK